MRALQITSLTGPESALELVDLPDPGPRHGPTGGDGIVIDVHGAGVSFPEVLQTRGEYQMKPPLPFVPGSEIAGIVRSAPEGAAVRPGDRVAAFCLLGGFAEVAVAPVAMTFPLDERLGFDQGAGLVLNYHTAYFSLVTRGRLIRGETVLVHGAAGGVGTAAIQIAKGLGARVVALVSGDAKERIARMAGADEVVRSGPGWRAHVLDSMGPVDLVIDPVGGNRFTDSLRCLGPLGRIVVVGFADGGIPEVRVNRLLLNNLEVIGAGWGAYVLNRPEVTARVADELAMLVRAGAVAPIVGATFAFEDAASALLAIDRRTATGKVVLRVRD
ncbi:NADPH:quinone oxidoreductase family protein [Patulibacter sp. NPDC049589]|uniref:NADPH:quinone oxidoreductase family protein n=1 Tax=Patulibacter sp. NPDC049589 TaxID=3154731 RepID=UPI003434FF5C